MSVCYFLEGIYALDECISTLSLSLASVNHRRRLALTRHLQSTEFLIQWFRGNLFRRRPVT